MTEYNRTLVTGAAGNIGRRLRESGRGLGRIVRLSDLHPITDLAAHEEDCPADLADFDAVSAAVEGCDAIVHLGAIASEGTWQAIHDVNILGGYHIYEAARRHGVKRIVYASSIHAVGFYERTHTIDSSVPTRPDTLYGLSKTFVENLASLYWDKFRIETVAVRIGSCFPEPADRRQLITWLSYGDCAQLVEKALSVPRVGFMVCYATSNNSESFWDNRGAWALGYQPRDSADAYREKLVASTPQGDPEDPAIRYQGGVYITFGHYDDQSSRQQ